MQYNPAKICHYTTVSPILTISSIESVHDLHGFFQALLARSSRSPSTTMITPTGGGTQPTGFNLNSNVAPSGQAQQQSATPSNSKQTTPMMFKRNPKRTSKGGRASGKRAAKRGNGKVPSTPISTTMSPPSYPSNAPTNSVNNNTSSMPPSNTEYCSLDDLFINIDRIIANDFLEPLPSENVSS